MDISDLEWWHWVIFAVPTLLLFVFVPVYVLWLGPKPRIPKGTRIDKRIGRILVHVVWHPDGVMPGRSNREAVAYACAQAVRCTRMAWVMLDKDDADIIDEVVVWFQPGSVFSKPGAAAYATWSRSYGIGRGVPMAVIRTEYCDEVIKRGEPVIHEMLHALHDYDARHKAKDVWAVHGDGAAQAIARRAFMDGDNG